MNDKSRGERFVTIRETCGPSGHATERPEWCALFGKDADWWRRLEKGHKPGGGREAVEACLRKIVGLKWDASELTRYAFEGGAFPPKREVALAPPAPRDPPRLPELAADAPLAVIDFEVTCRQALAALKRGEPAQSETILQYAVDMLDKAPAGSKPRAEPDTIVASPSPSGGIGRRARFRAQSLLDDEARIISLSDLRARFHIPCLGDAAASPEEPKRAHGRTG